MPKANNSPHYGHILEHMWELFWGNFGRKPTKGCLQRMVKPFSNLGFIGGPWYFLLLLFVLFWQILRCA